MSRGVGEGRIDGIAGAADQSVVLPAERTELRAAEIESNRHDFSPS
jgi:hypothetical protein